MILTGGYSIMDLKQAILKRREPEALQVEESTCYVADTESQEVVLENVKEETVLEIEKKLVGFLKQIKEFFQIKKENKEEIPMVIYPEDEEEESEMTINPTICLAATLGEPQGRLIYEGMGDYPDFELEKGSNIVGKNPRVKLYINRETISQFHAKFDYMDKRYYLEDMNSTNGTYVNDEILNYKEKRALSPGDVLRFADVKYRFL